MIALAFSPRSARAARLADRPSRGLPRGAGLATSLRAALHHAGPARRGRPRPPRLAASPACCGAAGRHRRGNARRGPAGGGQGAQRAAADRRARRRHVPVDAGDRRRPSRLDAARPPSATSSTRCPTGSVGVVAFDSEARQLIQPTTNLEAVRRGSIGPTSARAPPSVKRCSWRSARSRLRPRSSEITTPNRATRPRRGRSCCSRMARPPTAGPTTRPPPRRRRGDRGQHGRVRHRRRHHRGPPHRRAGAGAGERGRARRPGPRHRRPVAAGRDGRRTDQRIRTSGATCRWTQRREVTDWFAGASLLMLVLAASGSLFWFGRLP